VELTRPYYLGVFAVTQEQFQRVLGNNPSHFCASGPGRTIVQGLDTSTFPVDSVTWNRAVAFCRKLSKLPEEKKAGRFYRLPTEAEWEHACRAGAADAPFHFGASLGWEQANFRADEPYGGAAKGPTLGRPCPVGSYAPNAFGLYDMHGNVCDHCHDWGGEAYPNGPRKDPEGTGPSATHVLRGGSWQYRGASLRTAYRDGISPTGRNNVVGFRVACVLASWPG
jgi:formylglycine-generating enzyme required for sulfatase activity